MGWLLPIIKTIAPKSVLTLKQVGDAMINVTQRGYDKSTLEVKDINELSKN